MKIPKNFLNILKINDTDANVGFSFQFNIGEKALLNSYLKKSF